jgi:ribosome biogenesis GTPase / thiamine phosphate phosphatase
MAGHSNIPRKVDFEKEKALKKARRQLKLNKKNKSVRQRSWQAETAQEKDMLMSEPVIPKGRRPAKRGNFLAAGNVTLPGPNLTDASLGASGTVIAAGGSECRVEIDGRLMLCRLRGSSIPAEEGGLYPVVGDHVIMSSVGGERGIIETVLPRRNALQRPDPGNPHRSQVIAANADQLLIVAAWQEPALWLELIDRYLIAASRFKLMPILCLNKIDLAESERLCVSALDAYRGLDIHLIMASVRLEQGLDELRSLLSGKVTIVAGQSGVGKSSLITALEPALKLESSAISERIHFGRHTTTQSGMYPFASGGYVIDTPGIREFGLAGLRRREISAYFPELRALQKQCRFSNCRHEQEPDCAVRQAAEEGLLAVERYQNYLKILSSLPE